SVGQPALQWIRARPSVPLCTVRLGPWSSWSGQRAAQPEPDRPRTSRRDSTRSAGSVGVLTRRTPAGGCRRRRSPCRDGARQSQLALRQETLDAPVIRGASAVAPVLVAEVVQVAQPRDRALDAEPLRR